MTVKQILTTGRANALQWTAGAVLIALLGLPALAAPPVPQDTTDYHVVVWDTDEFPSWFPKINPYNQLASMNSWTVPVLDHTGQPHQHGHAVQLLMDGGNGLQDPPRADGSPGGDDSLAYGNMNMIRLQGLETDSAWTGRTGMFYSQRYFIPYSPNRAYYLRLWEGEDPATAPYYQDTVEYEISGEDHGGAMVTLREGPPVDLDWRFGPSKPRPQASATSAKP